MPSLSHLNSCTATKSNLYPANFLAAAVSEPALYGLLTFQVQNLRSLLRCSVRTKMSVQVRGFVCDIFRNKTCFYGEELLAPLPTPQAGGPPLVDCPRLLIQCICSYPPYWRLFLHQQPEDVPCCGDRDPLITWGRKGYI